MRDLTGQTWEDIVRAVSEPPLVGMADANVMHGTVVELNGTGAVTVMLDGDPIPGLRHLSSYEPVVGDDVWILQSGPDFIVIGKPRRMRTDVAGLLPRPVLVGQPGSPTSFLNGWQRMSSTAEGPANYWKDYDGVVHLAGTMRSGTANQPAFVLPEGYRPSHTLRFVVPHLGSLAPLYVDIEVRANGQVVPINGPWFTNSGLSTATGFSLERISFMPAEGEAQMVPMRTGYADGAGEWGSTAPYFDLAGAQPRVFKRWDGWCLSQGHLRTVPANQVVASLPPSAASVGGLVYPTWTYDGATIAERLDHFGTKVFNRKAGAATWVGLNGQSWFNWEANDTKWIDMDDTGILNTFNWEPWPGSDSEYLRPAVRKDADGVVHLRGLVRCHSTASEAGTPNKNTLLLAVFPDSYMPVYSGTDGTFLYGNIRNYLTHATFGAERVRLYRYYQGSFVANALTCNGGTVGYWFSLAGISWRTDNNAKMPEIV